MNQRYKQKGFTMVELMLAMAFVAILLILIAVSIIYISRIYNKGVTIKEVNQVGRTVADDFTRSISESMPFTGSDNVKIEGDRGYFCTGRYTYVWNTGRILSGSHNRYLYEDLPASDSQSVIRLARFNDTEGLICRYGIGDDQAPKLLKSKSVELLASGDRDLAVQDFNITQVASDTPSGQALYLLEYTIGTNDPKTLSTDRNSCIAPGDIDKNTADSTDSNYCAVNSFSIVVRAGSKI